MLSSSTLKLKFMQRGNSQHQPPTCKPESLPDSPHPCPASSSTPSHLRKVRSPTTASSAAVGCDTKPQVNLTRCEASESSCKTKLESSKKVEIIYEASLIGFPLISCPSFCSALPPNFDPIQTLPHHIGRRSYGHFNKEIEKLGRVHDPMESAAKTPSSLKAEPDMNSEGPRLGSKRLRPTLPSQNSSKLSAPSSRRPSTASASDPRLPQNGFKKPYASTLVKSSLPSKRKTSTKDGSEQGVDNSTSKFDEPETVTKKAKKVKISNLAQHDDVDSETDDEEDQFVSQQIENMFLEARQKLATTQCM